MRNHNTKSLPKWAQKHIEELENRIRRAEVTVPWTKPGMEWFTLLHPDNRAVEDQGKNRKLFMLGEDYAHPLCVVGPMDCVFVGRGKAEKEVEDRRGGAPMSTPDPIAGSPGPDGSAMDLLREILEKDREAIRIMQSGDPGYRPSEELRDLHRRIEACLSPNAPGSATLEAQP